MQNNWGGYFCMSSLKSKEEWVTTIYFVGVDCVCGKMYIVKWSNPLSPNKFWKPFLGVSRACEDARDIWSATRGYKRSFEKWIDHWCLECERILPSENIERAWHQNETTRYNAIIPILLTLAFCSFQILCPFRLVDIWTFFINSYLYFFKDFSYLTFLENDTYDLCTLDNFHIFKL